MHTLVPKTSAKHTLQLSFHVNFANLCTRQFSTGFFGWWGGGGGGGGAEGGGGRGVQARLQETAPDNFF